MWRDARGGRDLLTGMAKMMTQGFIGMLVTVACCDVA
jgi:hypothetical protein